MDCAELSWLSEMGLDNSFFTDQLCDFTTDNEILGHLDFDVNSGSSTSSTLINTPSTNSITSLCSENPAPHKLQKPNNFSTFSTSLPDNPNSSTPIILDFGKGVDRPHHPPLTTDEESEVVLRSQGGRQKPKQSQLPTTTTKKTAGGRVRPPSQTYDHIIAERKRRELLSQRFVALSTIVPGLKKMDKTSVLGDAIKYLKHLQERVKTLEKQATQQTMESAVLVRKSHVLMVDDVEEEVSSEYCSEDKDHQMQTLPEIEARVCNSHILVRVHCKRQHGILVNLLGEVEKLNLVVTNTNVSPFGSFALDITIVCEIEKEFELTVKQVVKTLRAALK